MVRSAHSDPAPATAVDQFLPIDLASARCKGCGLCVAACPNGVLALDTSVVNGLGHHPAHVIDGAACAGCARCARVCPEAAFVVYLRPRSGR